MKVVIDLKKSFEYILTTAFSIAMIWACNWGANFFRLPKIRNKGAAFNLFYNNPELIIVFSFLALVAIIFYALFRSNKLNKLNTNALSSLTAGIGMNFFERVTKGYVTDYIDLSFIPNMPVFNVADIFIVIGTLLLISSLFLKK